MQHNITTPPRRCCCRCCLSVCLSVVVQQDYCQTISFLIRPTTQKNLLTFDDDPIPDTDSGSRFHFPYHCVIGGFRRLIVISHTVNSRFSLHLAKRMTLIRYNILGAIRQISGSESGLIRKSELESRTMPWQDDICLSVRPSVCPSHAGILSKRLHISSKFFSPSGSPNILLFPTKRDGNIPTGTPLTGASNARGYEKITIFD